MSTFPFLTDEGVIRAKSAFRAAQRLYGKDAQVVRDGENYWDAYLNAGGSNGQQWMGPIKRITEVEFAEWTDELTLFDMPDTEPDYDVDMDDDDIAMLDALDRLSKVYGLDTTPVSINGESVHICEDGHGWPCTAVIAARAASTEEVAR